MLTDNVMAVLELFTTTQRELSVGEAANLLDRPKSTVSGWMSALERAGFLDHEPTSRRYRLGIRLAAIGELSQRSTSLQRAAMPILEALTRRTRETSSANVLLGSEVVNVAVVESPRPIQAAGGLGIPMPIHATAAGKVLVAWRREADIRHLLPPRLEQFTANTIRDPETLLEELDRVRAQGYGTAVGEMANDLFAESAPVRDSAGLVIGALSVAVPLSRASMDGAPAFGGDVIEAAKEVSLALGYREIVTPSVAAGTQVTASASG